MDRKLFGIFSGWQLTIMFGIAVITPGALYGAVATQAVSITDPNTAAKSYVDAGRKVWTYDPIAGYRNTPGSYVDIFVSNAGTRCETNYSFPIPTGKALILTAITGFESGSGAAGFYVYANDTCSGRQLTAHYSSLPGGKAPVEVDLGSGIAVPAGSVVTVFSSVNSGYTHLHGYLVPASAVPTTTSAASAEQGARATDLAEKTKQR